MLTEEDIKIAELTLMGETTRNIEKATGIDHVTVWRRQKDEDLKEYIKRLHALLIVTCLHHSVRNAHHSVSSYITGAKVKALTKDGKEIDVPDAQLREHGHKMSIKIMEGAGILPANSQTIMIQQIYNDHRTEMPEAIKELFAAVTHRDQNGRSLLTEGDVIDLDPGDDKARGGTK